MAADTPVAKATAALKQVYRWLSPQKICFSAKVLTGVGDNMDISQWRHVVVVLVAEDTGAGVAATVKIQGSMLDSNAAALLFGSAASLTNLWGYVSSYDAQEGVTAVAGATGYVLAAAGVTQILVNTDHLRSLNVELTRTNGRFTAYVYGCNAQ